MIEVPRHKIANTEVAARIFTIAKRRYFRFRLAWVSPRRLVGERISRKNIGLLLKLHIYIHGFICAASRLLNKRFARQLRHANVAGKFLKSEPIDNERRT
jgi:hypothetical protein